MKMKISKLLAWSIILVLVLGINIALAKDSGNPFNTLWQAIAYLQEQIDDIELIPGPPGQQGEPGPIGPSLKVVDDNDQDLGLLVNVDANANTSARYFTTYISESDFLIRFKQAKTIDNFTIKVTIRQEAVYYLEPNCNGNPYARNSYFSPSGFKSYSGNRFFRYTDDTGASLQSESYLRENGCINGVYSDTLLYLVEEITPPFSYPVSGPLRIVEQ